MNRVDKTLAKNYIYNFVYQFFKVFAPVLITPYIARVLGESNIGKYSFVYSIMSYFFLFASFGYQNYAQRLVASHQGDKKKQTEDLIEIIIARAVTIFISLLIYYFYVFKINSNSAYNSLFIILSIEIISVTFDISFFMQGNEEFKNIVISYSFIRILCYMLIFIFVKNQNDLWKYVLIQSLSLLLANLSLWLYLPKYLVKFSFLDLNVFRHIIPSFLLFIPTIAISVSSSIGKTMIGLITKSEIENGNFEYADKIIRISLTLVTSLGTVIIPRNVKRFSDGDIKSLNSNVHLSISYVFFLGFALMFGSAAISKNLIPWFLGNIGYEEVSNIILFLSPLIIVGGITNVFGYQYLIPVGKDMEFSFITSFGCVANVVLSIPCINILNSYGAAIAAVLAETIVALLMYLNIKKVIDKELIDIKHCIKCFFAGVIMFAICYVLSVKMISSIINTLLIIAIGAILYLAILFILKDDFLYMIVGDLLRKLKKNEKQ